MKKILVPFDFTATSERALEFAVLLANRSLSQISLCHVLTHSRSAEMEQYLETDAEEALEGVLYNFRPLLKEGPSMTGSTLTGSPAEVIREYARQGQFDLIIMGTQGEKGIKGFLMGSTTLEVSRQTTVPLLAIPDEAVIQPPKHFVLAIDEQGVLKSESLNAFRQLAMILEAEVSVYHQSQDRKQQVPNLLVDAALENIEHHFHQEVSQTETWEDIQEFTERQGADLLCLIRRSRGFFQQLFHHSVIKEELSVSRVPVLLLPE